MKHQLLSILLALGMIIALLTAAVYLPATADWVMRPLLERFAPPEVSHLPDAEYEPVVEMICDYLHGDTPVFQHVFTVDGTEYAAFNQKEQQHMADVQDLFRLCRVVNRVCLGMLLLGGCAVRRRLDWRAFRRTLLVILGVVAVVILLACIDFDGLFTLFHRIAFTNDLWLLNPQTDLLIRLMPIQFFISYAAIIGGLWLAGMGALLAFTTCRIKITEGE